jgi:hypothetical protein
MSQVRELIWKVVDGEAMILDVTSGDYFSLNRVATEVWTALQAGGELETIVEATAARYRTDRAKVEQDVVELVRDLEEIGLLTR